MASDNTVPTQPHNEPVDTQNPLRYTPPEPPLAPGHWYSFPGQQPFVASPASKEAGSDAALRGRGRSARDRVRRRKVRREMGAPDDWAWVIIAAALLGMTVVMSMSVFFLLQATRGANGSTDATSAPPIEPTSVLYGPGGIVQLEGDEPVGGMLGNGESMVIRPWDGEERFTVLVMGLDERPGEFGTSFRTDTLILIRLDPVTKHIGILNIPRDLWVEVPGYSLQRINTAYMLGELREPGGGPGLAIQTVQYNFGIRVNEYIVVNFDTFIDVIDLIGGVDVNVATDIYDPEYPDMNYGYDPFYLPAGWQHLDGATALKYARSRHGSDDIDRGRRQQQVLYAVRDRVLAYDMIAELAPKAPLLWSEMSEGVQTGLSLEQMVQLAWWAKDIPSSNYKNAVLSWDYVISTNWEGQAVLIPDRNKLGALFSEVFGPDYGE